MKEKDDDEEVVEDRSWRKRKFINIQCQQQQHMCYTWHQMMDKPKLHDDEKSIGANIQKIKLNTQKQTF